MRAKRSRSGNRRRLVYLWLFGLATLATFLTTAAFNQTVLDRLAALVFDGYQQVRPRAEAGAPAVVVDVDEASLRALGQWPWPRPVLARLIDRLGELGAATIAFDMVFAEPDRTSLGELVRQLEADGATVMFPAGHRPVDNDTLLGEAFARNNVTAGFVVSSETASKPSEPKAGFSFAGDDPREFLASFRGAVTNVPVLDGSARGLGFFSFPPSRDGIVRIIPLVARIEGQLFPQLAIEALRVAQGAASYVIRSTGASGEADTGDPAMTALRVGAVEVPTGPAGEFWIYFSGLPSLRTIPAAALLDPVRSRELADAVAGRIVLVGSSAAGLRDLVATPMSASTPGVRVHVEIIDQILSGTYLTRPDWAKGAEVATAFLLGVLLLAIQVRAGALVSASGALLVIGIALAISWIAFAHGRLLLDPILPGAAVAAVFGVTMPLRLLLTDREKQFVRRAFDRYLSPTLVERLADNPAALRLGGETRELTILFSDIRGFTSLSEGLDPQRLTHLLNDFLTPMTDVLLRSDATIDKYMGDAIMAFWNAPVDIPGHRRQACLAALQMLETLETLNASLEVPISIGIGLNTGDCCVGNLGSAQRFSYSAIGDSVNVASRVESLTKSYGVPILVTDSTASGAPELAFLEADLVRVVGRANPVPLFALFGDDAFAKTAEFAVLAAAHRRMIAGYRAADWDAAETALAEARKLARPDMLPLFELYSGRIAEMRAAPPPPDWDGVFVSLKK